MLCDNSEHKIVLTIKLKDQRRFGYFQDKSVKVTPVSGVDGDKVTFSCPLGYTLTGEKEARCTASNKWSVMVRTCNL